MPRNMLTLVLIIAITLASLPNLGAAGDQAVRSPDSCEWVARADYGGIPKMTAIENAMSSQEFSSRIVGYKNVTFDSMFATGTLDSLCHDTSRTVHVVFGLYNSSGFAGYLVVSEDTSTLSPFAAEY